MQNYLRWIVWGNGVLNEIRRRNRVARVEATEAYMEVTDDDDEMTDDEATDETTIEK
jgi:hypothetical protein